MRPIKAHELSHRGAMAQLMQRRAGVVHAQDSRSRLVQRLPRPLPPECILDRFYGDGFESCLIRCWPSLLLSTAPKSRLMWGSHAPVTCISP